MLGHPGASVQGQNSEIPAQGTRGVQGPSMAEQLADFPRVREWMGRVRDTLEPHYSDVHAMLDKAAKNAQRRKERSQAKL